ncbi:MAG: DUF2162 domain-containing protein [Deltaproteobacteria bacterium]|nr:DUF2162 domain-containing protein [Deltaproteobacteria bacterium]
MELKTLWLGLLVSMLAFSVKTGLGWSYLYLKCPKEKRRAATLGVVLMYLVLFAAVLALVSRINILAHYEFLAPLWQRGITLHWLVALLLILWGLILLRSPSYTMASCAACEGPQDDLKAKDSKGSYAWIPLVIPCPVCLSVILMSLAGLVMYFPKDAAMATLLLYLAFLVVAGTAGILMIWGKNSGGEPLEHTLGFVMILIAAYFIISALVMPQFSSVSRIYRIASYSQESDIKFGTEAYCAIAIMAFLLIVGFIKGRAEVKNGKIK